MSYILDRGVHGPDWAGLGECPGPAQLLKYKPGPGVRPEVAGTSPARLEMMKLEPSLSYIYVIEKRMSCSTGLGISP